MRKKILAGLMSTALLCSLIPASYSLINNESSSFFSVDGAELSFILLALKMVLMILLAEEALKHYKL